MSYSITSTAVSAAYASPLWDIDGTKSTLYIQNQSANPVYFELDKTVATATSAILAAGQTIPFPNDSCNNIAFISPAGNSVVCVWTA